MNSKNLKPSRSKKLKQKKAYTCPCCKQIVRFCWKCTCDFMICQICMEENAWGLTCNHVTWTCPDCGKVRSY